MPKLDKKDVRNAKRSASARVKGGLRLSNSSAVQANKIFKEAVKAGRKTTGVKAQSSGMKVTKTNSAKKPSMPVKTGVKNKMKTQGKAATQSGKGYMRTGKN